MKIVGDMLMMQLAETVRDRLPGVLAVYVFGSVAAGNAGHESDLDLAVLAAGPLPAVQLWETAQQLSEQTACSIDLVDLRTASAVMRMEVIGHGRRLLCDDAESAEAFEDFVFADHARLNEERAAILEDIRERGHIYG